VKDSLLGGANEAVASAASSNAVAGASGSDGVSPLLREWGGRKWTSCFNDAYDSLSRRNGQLFWKGLACYMGMRMALIRLGAPFASARTGRIATGELVKVATLDEDLTDADQRIFSQPLALAELGRYVIRLNRGAWARWATAVGIRMEVGIRMYWSCSLTPLLPPRPHRRRHRPLAQEGRLRQHEAAAVDCAPPRGRRRQPLPHAHGPARHGERRPGAATQLLPRLQ
jgi:hypothetical protein